MGAVLWWVGTEEWRSCGERGSARSPQDPVRPPRSCADFHTPYLSRLIDGAPATA